MLTTMRLVAVLVAVAWLSPATAEAAGRLRRSAPASCPAWRPCGPGIVNRVVPQGIREVDFRPACLRHDQCYQTPGAPRRDCDRQFLYDLRSVCEASGNPRGCQRRATVYYGMVRLFGGVVRSVEEVLPRRVR
jgi:hypothetical protein